MQHTPLAAWPIANPLCDASHATCANLAMHLCPVFCKMHPVGGRHREACRRRCSHAHTDPTSGSESRVAITPAGRSGMLIGSATVTNLNPAICWLRIFVLPASFNVTQKVQLPIGI